MLTLAIGAIGTVFGMGLISAIGNASDASDAQYKREAAQEAEWEARTGELEEKLDGLIDRYGALCDECNRLLTKAEDYSDRAYVESSERWSELADSYLEQYDICRDELKQVEKMIDEINLQLN